MELVIYEVCFRKLNSDLMNFTPVPEFKVMSQC